MDQDQAWRDQAACKGQGDLFFPPPMTDPRLEVGKWERFAKAKAICAECPVRDECLEWALDTELPHGIAGGLTENERNRIRRARWRRRWQT